MLATVENIDCIIKSFNNEDDFISYVQLIYSENEEENTDLQEPETFLDCVTYLREYCDNLTLTLSL